MAASTCWNCKPCSIRFRRRRWCRSPCAVLVRFSPASYRHSARSMSSPSACCAVALGKSAFDPVAAWPCTLGSGRCWPASMRHRSELGRSQNDPALWQWRVSGVFNQPNVATVNLPSVIFVALALIPKCLAMVTCQFATLAVLLIVGQPSHAQTPPAWLTDRRCMPYCFPAPAE
jgi:hypothetical protein